MIRIEKRKIRRAELQMLNVYMPSAWKRAEDFTLKLIIVVPLLLSPLLIYDSYVPVPSNVQAFWSIIVLTVAVFIARIWTKRVQRPVPGYSFDTVIEEVQVQTSRAVRREDPEDFGVAYYIDVQQDGQSKTLYLCGQYLDELEYEALDEETGLLSEKDISFPSTAFSFVRIPGSEDFIDFAVRGTYLEPETTLPAFPMDFFLSRNAPRNGDILDINLEEVIAIG